MAHQDLVARRIAARTLYFPLICGLILAYPMFYLTEHGSANSFATYLVTLALLPLLAVESRTIRSHDWRALITPVALVSYLALSSLWAQTQGEIMFKHFGYAALLLTFLVAFKLGHHRFPGLIPATVHLTVVAAVASACWSIYMHWANESPPWLRLEGYGRLNNPVVGGTAYGFALILAIHGVMFGKRIDVRLLLAAATIPLLTAVIMTGTRAIWPALLVSVAMGLWFLIRNVRWWVLATVVAASLMAAVLLWVVGVEDLMRRGFSYRPDIWWEMTTRTFSGNWLFGLGITADTTTPLPQLTADHGHNLFISTFLYGGMVGLALFALHLAQVAHTSYAGMRAFAPDKGTAMLCAMTLAYGLVLMLFDGDHLIDKINHIWMTIWFPSALALCINTEKSLKSISPRKD